MKRFLITFYTLITVIFSATAQIYVNGDINKDGNVSIKDVTKLVNIINGKENIQTPESLLAGIWFAKDGQFLSFNADGTTNDFYAKYFKFKNTEGKICYFDERNVEVMTLNVSMNCNAYMKIRIGNNSDEHVFYREELYDLIMGYGSPEDGIEYGRHDFYAGFIAADNINDVNEEDMTVIAKIGNVSEIPVFKTTNPVRGYYLWILSPCAISSVCTTDSYSKDYPGFPAEMNPVERKTINGISYYCYRTKQGCMNLTFNYVVR